MRTVLGVDCVYEVEGRHTRTVREKEHVSGGGGMSAGAA
jgi:hypothetical protein